MAVCLWEEATQKLRVLCKHRSLHTFLYCDNVLYSQNPGTEEDAVDIGASWLSRTGDGDGTLNLRGVSTALALAAFLKRKLSVYTILFFSAY
jgi:hypothetical protein